MNHTGSTFEMDRTPSGKIKINPINVGNLVALLMLIGVAAGTWTSLKSSVDVMGLQVSDVRESTNQLANDFRTSLTNQSADSRQLHDQLSQVQARLAVLENIVTRLDRKIDNAVPAYPQPKP